MGNMSSTPNNRCRRISHTRTNSNKIKEHYTILMVSPPLVLYGGRFKKSGSGGILPRQSITLVKATNRIKVAGQIRGQRVHRSAITPHDMTLTPQVVEQRLQYALLNQGFKRNRRQKVLPR